MKKILWPTIVDWIIFAASDVANSSRKKIMKNKEVGWPNNTIKSSLLGISVEDRILLMKKMVEL